MRILVVFTGGTIGSTKTDGVISPDKSNSYLLLDLYEKFDRSVDFVCVEPYTILSENLSGENLCLLYDCITANDFEKYDGVIVTHGTDTLQYTSAFLSYLFGLCKIPIVLVSANYPLADKRSNGFYNFRAAVDFVRAKLGKGVFVAYKNYGENPKIHLASRIIAHNAYDDKIQSVFNEFCGEIINGTFTKNILYGEKEDEVKPNIEALSKIKKGQTLTLNDFNIKEGETTPPSRYTSGSIILAMENAGKLIEDERLREQIKGSGIGTSATRAEIIKKLNRIGYININSKTQVLTPSEKGELVQKAVSWSMPDMLNPDLTASWEKGLDMVAKKEIAPKEFMDKLEVYIRTKTAKLKR